MITIIIAECYNNNYCNNNTIMHGQEGEFHHHCDWEVCNVLLFCMTTTNIEHLEDQELSNMIKIATSLLVVYNLKLKNLLDESSLRCTLTSIPRTNKW